MKISFFMRYSTDVLIMLLLFILTWLVSPALVFSQEEVPVFNADECPETSGGYIEADNGHYASTGFLNCNYYKESMDNTELSNSKRLILNYFSSPDEALEQLKESSLNDDNLSKFSCETFECDNFDRALLEKTEDSYLGYFIGKYVDPNNYVVEQCFVYDNFRVSIYAAGNLFSGIDEALSEMDELEVVAKQLVDEPRETVTRETSGDDCGCDDPTEEPTEVSEAESIEDDTEDEGDGSTAQGLAELITLYGKDPEKLSEWPGWEGLTDTQRNTLLTLIDRLDDVLNAESPESVIESDTVEENTDPEKVLLQASEILKDEFWYISTILNQFQIEYFQLHQTLKSDAFDGIDQHLIKTSDPVINMLFPVLDSSFEYSCVKLVSQNKEENNLSPEEIAQQALVAFLAANESQLPGVGYYKLYREEYDRIMNDAENITAEEAHQSAIEKIESLYVASPDSKIPDFHLKAYEVNALFNLRQRNVPVPNIPVSGEK